LNQASQQPKATTLPFRRDEDFVGREDILEEIGRKLTKLKSLRRVALIGLGGVGYSTLHSLICGLSDFVAENLK